MSNAKNTYTGRPLTPSDYAYEKLRNSLSLDKQGSKVLKLVSDIEDLVYRMQSSHDIDSYQESCARYVLTSLKEEHVVYTNFKGGKPVICVEDTYFGATTGLSIGPIIAFPLTELLDKLLGQYGINPAVGIDTALLADEKDRIVHEITTTVRCLRRTADGLERNLQKALENCGKK